MIRLFTIVPLAAMLGIALSFSILNSPGASRSSVLPVLAQGCTHSANSLCNGGADGTKTSAMMVRYNNAAASSVIPNGATNFTIAAYWYPPSGSNCTTTSVATCTVTWNGSAWSLSNVNLPADGEITGIALCSTAMCGLTSLAVGYNLIVNVNDPHSTTIYNLDHVDYTTTSVPNGTVCGGLGTTPISQTNSGTHSISTGNTNLCPLTCGASGGSMTIVYN